MRRAATVLLTAALTSGGMAALAPRASATTITPRNLTITVTNLGPEHRNCDIDADLYIPAGVSSSRPAPALLVTNGFGGTKDDQADLAQGFGEQGYITLSYTGIGFVDGDNCPITLDDREHDGGVSAPSVAVTQAGGPAGQLVAFAKLYDVGPDGAIELPHRLISPVRVADVTKPVIIELPGIVHRFAAGHRLVVVLAGGDMAYRGSTVTQPVTLVTGPGYTQLLTIPVTN